MTESTKIYLTGLEPAFIFPSKAKKNVTEWNDVLPVTTVPKNRYSINKFETQLQAPGYLPPPLNNGSNTPLNYFPTAERLPPKTSTAYKLEIQSYMQNTQDDTETLLSANNMLKRGNYAAAEVILGRPLTPEEMNRGNLFPASAQDIGDNVSGRKGLPNSRMRKRALEQAKYAEAAKRAAAAAAANDKSSPMNNARPEQKMGNSNESANTQPPSTVNERRPIQSGTTATISQIKNEPISSSIPLPLQIKQDTTSPTTIEELAASKYINAQDVIERNATSDASGNGAINPLGSSIFHESVPQYNPYERIITAKNEELQPIKEANEREIADNPPVPIPIEITQDILRDMPDLAPVDSIDEKKDEERIEEEEHIFTNISRRIASTAKNLTAFIPKIGNVINNFVEILAPKEEDADEETDAMYGMLHDVGRANEIFVEQNEDLATYGKLYLGVLQKVDDLYLRRILLEKINQENARINKEIQKKRRDLEEVVNFYQRSMNAVRNSGPGARNAMKNRMAEYLSRPEVIRAIRSPDEISKMIFDMRVEIEAPIEEYMEQQMGRSVILRPVIPTDPNETAYMNISLGTPILDLSSGSNSSSAATMEVSSAAPSPSSSGTVEVVKDASNPTPIEWIPDSNGYPVQYADDMDLDSSLSSSGTVELVDDPLSNVINNPTVVPLSSIPLAPPMGSSIPTAPPMNDIPTAPPVIAPIVRPPVAPQNDLRAALMEELKTGVNRLQPAAERNRQLREREEDPHEILLEGIRQGQNRLRPIQERVPEVAAQPLSLHERLMNELKGATLRPTQKVPIVEDTPVEESFPVVFAQDIPSRKRARDEVEIELISSNAKQPRTINEFASLQERIRQRNERKGKQIGVSIPVSIPTSSSSSRKRGRDEEVEVEVIPTNIKHSKANNFIPIQEKVRQRKERKTKRIGDLQDIVSLLEEARSRLQPVRSRTPEVNVQTVPADYDRLMEELQQALARRNKQSGSGLMTEIPTTKKKFMAMLNIQLGIRDAGNDSPLLVEKIQNLLDLGLEKKWLSTKQYISIAKNFEIF